MRKRERANEICIIWLLNCLCIYFTVSEAVYKEYDKLKNQYELETGTMQQAMQRASQVDIFSFFLITHSMDKYIFCLQRFM